MLLARTTDFDRALRRRFRTGVKDQRHAIAGWNFNQTSRRFGALILIRTANDLGQFFNQRPLLVNRKLGVTNDVNEQDMRDFQLDLLVDLGGHVGSRARVGDAQRIFSIVLPTVEIIAGTTKTPYWSAVSARGWPICQIGKFS